MPPSNNARKRAKLARWTKARENKRGAALNAALENGANYPGKDLCPIAYTCAHACKICPFGPRGHDWCGRPDKLKYRSCGGPFYNPKTTDARVIAARQAGGGSC
jgi:hypothetical protein